MTTLPPLPPLPPLDAIVFDPGEPWLAARTVRSLARRGVRADVATRDSLVDQVAGATRPIWLVRAGAWSLAAPSPTLLFPRAPSEPSVVALGATADSARWQAMLADTGGDLGRARGRFAARSERDAIGAFPRIDSAVALDPAGFAALVAEEGSVERAAAAAIARSRARVVRVPSLDVGFARSLRIVLAVTTLHRGGAERIVLDLAASLRADGHDVLLAVLDRASRSTFDAPPGTLFLDESLRDRRDRIALLARTAADRGADVVHVHLLDGDEVARLAAGDVPVAVTIHNARPGWPARFVESCARATAKPALVVGCSRDVTRELVLAGLDAPESPVRTIWNGIHGVTSTPASRNERTAIRASLGVAGAGPLLVAIANHRPQKRLERLPLVLAAVRRAGLDAKLLLVGEPVRSDAASVAVAGHVRAVAAAAGVAEHVVLAGSRADVAEIYAASDAVVSVSAFEGLSLVHLEALAAGLPLVATRVSGASELAAKHDRMHVVDLEAPPDVFAAAVVRALTTSPPAPRGRVATSALAPDYATQTMARRHAELFSRVASRAPRAEADGLVLVTNNFATGGAQASARRLLVALKNAGVPVRAIVIEEQADFPTPGRAALEAAGVPVVVAPRAGLVDPLTTARAVAAAVDAAAPRAVLFWNAIPEHKVLIADLLLGVDVWDVSPGEMYFASFSRYFGRPRVGSPYLDARDYGRLLRGAIVKYEAERERASDVLGARVEVVPNGVVVGERPLRRARRPGEALVVGTLARIAPDKKLEQLLDAVSWAIRRGAWPEGTTLAIAGSPERSFLGYADDLQARAEAARLPVVWCGERDSAAFLGEIDLFAMISEPSGCPNASLEAMAAGHAVVATAVGGALDQIVDGETGILVPRGDSEALGEALAELMSDEARRTTFGDAGFARARARFDVGRMAAEYARLCLDLDLGLATR